MAGKKTIKAKDQSAVNDQDQAQEQIPLTMDEREELEQLRARNAHLESSANEDSKYLQEMQDLKAKGNSGLQTIPYKEVSDVKYISLWHISGHNIGKRVGPIHPGAAEDTFLMFRKAGVRLSSKQPTPEFIAKYKETAEYKNAAEKERVRREAKKGKKGNIDKLIEAIAKDRGVSASEVVQIAGKPAGVNV